MKLARYVYLALLVIVLLALGVWQLFPGQAAADRGESKVPPRFVVDPDWPKQLPNNWLIGQVGGLAVDSHNNIWIIQRPRTLTNDEAGAVPYPPPYFPITTPPTTPRPTQPADVGVDDEAHELYVADGYGNKRVIVFDTKTGAAKRYWGAYGAPPCASPGNTRACVTGAYSPSAPPDPDFRNPVHCIRLVADLVYVCDRVNDRI